MIKISVTGTKGKTSVVRAIDFVIREAGQKTLLVDTDGHYETGRQRSSRKDSIVMSGIVPTVCPGRYITTLMGKRDFNDYTVVMEASLGCSQLSGLGYGHHQIGIFTNVFEDHIGNKGITSKKDLAIAKNFIFSRIGYDGYAVFNADDKHVCSQLSQIPHNRNITLIPVGIDFSHFNIHDHIKNGGHGISLEGSQIIRISKDKKLKLFDTKKSTWAFDGHYLPSVWNLMFTIGALREMTPKIPVRTVRTSLVKYKPHSSGGRLVRLRSSLGVEIVLDYAHEKQSLREIGILAQKIAKKRVIGVVRIAPDRTNVMISQTGKYISEFYDDFIVYDKIDGITRLEYGKKGEQFHRVPGEVSEVFHKSISENMTSGTSERIIREADAIKRASEIAQDGDVVIIIGGDNTKETLMMIKKHFSAKVL